jgi:nucleotide-binding universal stress UspA family protein
VTAVMRDWQDTLRQSPTKAEVIENVVVPLDGSAISKYALPVARAFAHIYGATMHVLYVGEELLGPRETLKELGLSEEEMRGAVLDQRTGDPAEAITKTAQRLAFPLLVMCTHTARRSDPRPIGAVTEVVLANAPARVVLISPDRARDGCQIRRVLLAHDGTPSADVAIAPAADVAHRASAEVIAMHVAARQAEPNEPGSLPAPRYVDQPQHEWPSWAGEFLGRMMALGAPPASINFKLLVTGGQPGSEVAQFARDHAIDLVVVSWRGRWEEPHAGTLKAIIHSSGCPVLLVHPREPRKPAAAAEPTAEVA